MKIQVLILLLCTSLLACGDSETTCPDSNCGNYITQQEAQADFDLDPECRASLDNDNDGIACEHLSSPSGGGCPTTASCGCSSKNKSDCGGPCCKWTVGSGCGCS